MSLANIRALIETQVNDAFQMLSPPVPVVFDNVQEEPPGNEYVILSISYPSFTEPVLCPEESSIECIRGSVQIACFTPRAQGMKRLEEMGTVAMQTLNFMKSAPDPNNVRLSIGVIAGPDPVLAGNQPYALVNIAAPFTAKG